LAIRKFFRHAACFTAGTQIIVGALFDENDIFVQYVTMNIEDIKVGDLVFSYDTLTGMTELKAVTAIFVREVDHINYLTIADEHGNIQTLEVTDGHPFWVVTDDPDLSRAASGYADGMYHGNLAPTENGFWVEAKDLREGDVFIGANGELSTVVSNERVEFPDGVTVYNFTVDGNHNYFVIAETDEFGQTCVLVHNALGLGYGKVIPQTAWWIRTTQGTYHGWNADSLAAMIQQIANSNSEKISWLIVKGHGGPTGMMDGENVLFAPDPTFNSITVGTKDVLSALKQSLDENASISLRGCNTYDSAVATATLLPGTSVKGNKIHSIGIPLTTWNISFWWGKALNRCS
jgi:hypothetical protein